MNRSLLSSILLATLAAGTAHAGTVYVPLPGQNTVGTSTYEVQVSIANTAAAPATVNEALLPSDADGTQRTGVTAGTLGVNGGQTSVVKPGATFSGLLELSGASDFRYSARMVNLGGGGLGVDLPLITSSTVTKANGRLSVQGLISDATRTTDLALVNLATTASQCTVNLARSDGSALGATATVSMNPLSHRYFTNVLSGLVDASGVADARAQVSCTQDFYSYGVLKNSATGEMVLVQPAASGDSTLGTPGTTPPPTGGGCGSAGVTCFDARGVVHQPTPVNPVGRLTFAFPQAVYTRFKMSMDITVGQWYAPDPEGKALIYWFVIDKNLDMPGMLYFRGPGPGGSVALVRHGIGLTHPEKGKIQKSFHATIGHTYHCDNDYDMGRGVYTVTITDKGTGEVQTVLTAAPNVHLYASRPGQHFIIDMGFKENGVPDEVPSFNWLYQNVHIEAYHN
ncbi:MAG TPA: hypothetical protein VGS07_32675 [Thermoanaerobaculia bacterium]|jgi:hypothetical protein|nr:hypothetical protein [Thermoanaerobaculia bacterium]